MTGDRIKHLVTQFTAGVVGMNFRNRHLVAGFNPAADIATARDKIASKERLTEAGVPVAPTLAVIRRASEIDAVYAQLLEQGEGFVIKPSRSAQGRGILLCRRAEAAHVVQLSGIRLPREEFLFHLNQILHGEFSFGRPDDAVLVETLLETDANWVLPGLSGSPDLRIVLFQDEPQLAMARLPTEHSDGRANLHCGAVGVGIDLRTGITCGGVQWDRLVEEHPDTGAVLAGHPVLDFAECVTASIRSAKAFELGFIGVDLMRDRFRGPIVVEVNARPGLALQLANRRGLFTPPAPAA